MTIRSTVITDASHCPKTGAAGFGAYIRIDGHPAPFQYSGPLKPPTHSSTFAEVRAALIGIWYAAKLGATDVLIQSDCMTIIHLANGRCKSAGLVALWREAMLRPDMQVRLEARHVKGHIAIKDARSWVNDWCDKQAKKHMYNERRLGRGA